MSTTLSTITPIEMAAELASNVLSSSNAKSLSEYTAPTRQTATALIDRGVLDVDSNMVKALLQTLLSIYSAHYLQAVGLSATVGDVRVLKLLDQFSSADPARSFVNKLRTGNESYDSDSLPTFGLEFDDNPVANADDRDKNTIIVSEDSNLAVGKLLNVRVTVGEQSTTMPVTVNILPQIISGSDVVSIVADTNADRTMSGRWHQWRSGQIRFFADYILALDMIESDRKAILADSTGHLLRARDKQYRSRINRVLSGKANVNEISAMIIVSQSTAKSLELAIRGKLSSGRTRRKFFEQTSSMMLVVVDTVMERFSIYQRGIDEVGMYTLDDIKNNNKRAGNTDVESMLQAFKLGNAPQL